MCQAIYCIFFFTFFLIGVFRFSGGLRFWERCRVESIENCVEMKIKQNVANTFNMNCFINVCILI